MKLLTQAIRKKLPPIGSQEGKGDETIAYVKFFTPWTNWTWYAAEFDGEDMFYGKVVGHETELGYFTLRELQSVTGPFKLQIERDMHWSPRPLKDCK